MTDYHRMPIAEKRALNLATVRESPVRCPHCDIGVTVADLLAHVVGRCSGRPSPHSASRWLSRSDASTLGMPEHALRRLAAKGIVRTRIEKRRTQYLERDVVLELARGAYTVGDGKPLPCEECKRRRARGRDSERVRRAQARGVPVRVPATTCACGCGAALSGNRADQRFASKHCRRRAWLRARRAGKQSNATVVQVQDDCNSTSPPQD